MSHNTNNISINNFNNLCRTCAQSNELVSIYENIYLLEMLSTSAQIQIQLNDELPKNICLNCIKELNQSYAFISKCRTNDSAFRQCLMQQKLLNLRKNYEKPHQKSNNNKVQITEEIYIKTETSDIDDCNDSISDECSKQSTQNMLQLNNIECETKCETNVCTNCDKTFTLNTEFISHLNVCQFKNLIEPMELNESSDDEFHDDPLDVSATSLPEKSRVRYKRERILFLTYCKQNNLTEYTEDVVLDYFLEKSKTMKASSLWSLYSMLKSTLILDNVDISKYTKLLAFLKEKNAGYKSAVSKAFTREEINKFLYEAPDETYLMMKVAMIMGIAGGCQRDELMRMSMDHIEDKDSVLIVTVPIPKTNNARTFLITSRESDWLIIYRKYYSYRALLNTEHRRLFVNYKNGKFTNVPAGKNTLGKFPKLIAEYLNLTNPAQYTGHCFRRTSAMLFNKRGIWKSSVILEGDDSIQY